MHFGISEGKGGVKTWKPSVVGYGYFLELSILSQQFKLLFPKWSRCVQDCTLMRLKFLMISITKCPHW